uniref:RING-type E3 ubiquitin transferase n=1 Tax=Mesocestoides corti TaxID=53468 RepID=A0A5K3FQ49_MESCO
MFLFVSVISSLISLASSTLILISAQRNVSVEFEDAEASFGAVITEDMPMGKISESSPLNACELVKPPPNGRDIFFALIHRGDCTFAEKVLAVQKANFSGAIIVNTESDYVFPMSSNATFNVNIPAIMVGRSSGNTIRSQYLYLSGYLARMKPNPGTVIEYYLVPFLITLSLAFFGIIIFLAFRVFRTCLRQSKNRLSRDSLNKLPEIRYSEDYQNLYETCAICLEDYAMGDKLRVLPCHHDGNIDTAINGDLNLCITKPSCSRRSSEVSIKSVVRISHFAINNCVLTNSVLAPSLWACPLIQIFALQKSTLVFTNLLIILEDGNFSQRVATLMIYSDVIHTNVYDMMYCINLYKFFVFNLMTTYFPAYHSKCVDRWLLR